MSISAARKNHDVAPVSFSGGAFMIEIDGLLTLPMRITRRPATRPSFGLVVSVFRAKVAFVARRSSRAKDQLFWERPRTMRARAKALQRNDPIKHAAELINKDQLVRHQNHLREFSQASSGLTGIFRSAKIFLGIPLARDRPARFGAEHFDRRRPGETVAVQIAKFIDDEINRVALLHADMLNLSSLLCSSSLSTGQVLFRCSEQHARARRRRHQHHDRHDR
jgi:hypothetical protein